MSMSSFKAFLNTAASDPAQAAALRDALASGQALTAYAAVHGYTLDAGEADALIRQAREQINADSAQALSDESLDHVSGAGPRKAHFS